MGALFKHNGIYVAIVTIISLLSVYESFAVASVFIFLIGWLMYKRYSAIFCCCLVLFGVISFTFFSITKTTPSVDLTKAHIVTVINEPKINGNSMRGFVKAEDGQELYFAYTFQSEEEKEDFVAKSMVGMKWHVLGELEESIPAHEYAFSMDRYLKSKNAIGTYAIETLSIVEEESSPLYWLSRQRFKVKNHIADTFPPSLVAEAQALLIGVQEEVDVDMSRAYQKLGITHLFAISGLHVALLSLLFYQGLIRCKVRVEVASFILVIILPMYAVLAGGAPSVWRAVAVVLIIALGKLLKRPIPVSDALAYSCVLFLFISPTVLYQIGFQLSYLATLSLIFSGNLFKTSTNLWVQNFYMTLVSQLLTYPILLYSFYELSLSSFVANIVFVPLFSFVIVPINVLLLLLSYILPFLAKILFLIYEPCREFLAILLLWLKDVPYQMWVPGKPTLLWILLFYFSIFLALIFLEKKLNRLFILSLLIIPMLFSFRYALIDHLEVTFINVGQGDSILIELPRRKEVYLIDTGGLLRFQTDAWQERDQEYEIGRQIVVPYLKGKGIAKIDKLILTHADADHVEGAEEVLKEITVQEVHVTPNSSGDASMSDLVKEAVKRKIPLKERIAGMHWTIKDVHFQYLWPEDLEYEGNNDSLVLFIQCEAFRVLITGDLEAEGEAELIKRYPNLLKNLTILKAGHHGSKTSSSEAFIDLTNPSITIFTAGKDNRYHHPATEVVNRFKERSLKTYTTGYDGTITVKVRNNMIQLKASAEEFE